jgi:efflux transporter, outer membrane factor (OMF) lipoprotein, NodT family
VKYHKFIPLILLAGCVPTATPYAPLNHQVSLPASLQPPGAPVHTQTDTSLPDHWWTKFQNPELNRLVDDALRHNPGLQATHSRMETAQAQVMQSQSALYPHLNSVAALTHIRISRNGPTEPYSGVTANLATFFPLFVNYDLDLWGRDDELIDAAKASAEIRTAQYRQSALMLSSAVIKTFFALTSATRMVELQTAVVHAQKDKVHLLERAFQAGLSPLPPVSAASSAWHEEQATLEQLKRHQDVLKFTLYALLGRNPEDTNLATSRPIPHNFPLPETLTLDLISQRPDVQAALWKIKTRIHLEKAARLAYYPNINLFGLMGYNSIGISDLITPAGGTYAYGPAVDLPIFEGGLLEGRLHASEAERDAAIHDYNQTLVNAVRDIANALTTLNHHRTQLDNLSAAVANQTTETESDRVNYQSGVSGKLPFINASIQLEKEKMKETAELLAWLTSITDTATSLGGGFGRWPA